MDKNAIIDGILKEALPMMVMDPTRHLSREILTALRSYFGVEATEKPLWRSYITKREGTSNKFHYFVVFPKGDQFVAANAYGRIGYTPKVFDLGEFGTKEQALAVAKNKLKKKISDGYQINPLYHAGKEPII